MTDSSVCTIRASEPLSHFTGKERDAESGNDYFDARYYSSSMGRFLSPDPFIPFNLKKDQFQAWISNPQHWNKYAYALNNPLMFTDPTGMTETHHRKRSFEEEFVGMLRKCGVDYDPRFVFG
jgi:RHS repeat-associated protein